MEHCTFFRRSNRRKNAGHCPTRTTMTRSLMGEGWSQLLGALRSTTSTLLPSAMPQKNDETGLMPNFDHINTRSICRVPKRKATRTHVRTSEKREAAVAAGGDSVSHPSARNQGCIPPVESTRLTLRGHLKESRPSVRSFSSSSPTPAFRDAAPGAASSPCPSLSAR